MPRVVRCPNCGAPLRTDTAGGARCAYCGTPVVRDTSEFEARQSMSQTRDGAKLRGTLVAIALVVPAAIVGFSFSRRSVTAPVHPTPRPSLGQATRVTAVPVTRLGSVDVTMNVDAEKVRMPREFPEAKGDMYQIEYAFDLAHPALKDARVGWEWGCNCLSHVNFSFKDYPTEKRASTSFVPCVAATLGAPSRSNPPFSYDWDAHGDWPRLSVAQGIRVDLGSPPVQQHWQRMLEVIDRCARTIGAGSP